MEGWDTIANISGFLGPFLSPAMSKDITCYYHLRIRICQVQGDDYGEPVLRARTWPGAPEDDPRDFWRGLQEDTVRTRIFKDSVDAPDLSKNLHMVPPQAQPQCVGEPGTPARQAYVEKLAEQRLKIEKLMELFPGLFTPENKMNMRTLLEALGSNLDPSDPVQCDWTQEDVDFLYAAGQYSICPSAEDDVSTPNLFEDPAVNNILVNRPDPMRDPRRFVQAMAQGDLDPQNEENCYACVLEKGAFYLQRPADGSDAPFELVRVMRSIPDVIDPSIQWGAWCQKWEVSTAEDSSTCYITDPYHARADQPDGQRYNNTLDDSAQPWTYDKMPLQMFQDVVNMTKKWNKPRNFKKKLNGGAAVSRGVLKRAIAQKSHRKVRMYAARYQDVLNDLNNDHA